MQSTYHGYMNKDGRMAGQIDTSQQLCLVYEFYSKNGRRFFSDLVTLFCKCCFVENVTIYRVVYPP